MPTLEQQFNQQQFSNGYELVNGVAMQAENGDRFQIPPDVIKRHVGVGQFVDLSQFETLASMVGTALQEALVHGQTTARLGNTPPAAPAAPHGICRCRDLPEERGATDRWCAIAVFGDIDWERFITAIGSPAWTRQERFASFAGRLAAGHELDRRVQAWTR